MAELNSPTNMLKKLHISLVFSNVESNSKCKISEKFWRNNLLVYRNWVFLLVFCSISFEYSWYVCGWTHQNSLSSECIFWWVCLRFRPFLSAMKRMNLRNIPLLCLSLWCWVSLIFQGVLRIHTRCLWWWSSMILCMGIAACTRPGPLARPCVPVRVSPWVWSLWNVLWALE